jgi:hypothetical protein
MDGIGDQGEAPRQDPEPELGDDESDIDHRRRERDHKRAANEEVDH